MIKDKDLLLLIVGMVLVLLGFVGMAEIRNKMKVELTSEQINHLINLTNEKDHKDILSTDCFYALQEAKDILYEANFLEEKCNYRLSDNQRRFVIDALTENYEVDFYYSGRGMRGAYCPSIIVKREKTFSSDAKILQDSLGHDTVIYARD